MTTVMVECRACRAPMMDRRKPGIDMLTCSACGHKQAPAPLTKEERKARQAEVLQRICPAAIEIPPKHLPRDPRAESWLMFGCGAAVSALLILTAIVAQGGA